MNKIETISLRILQNEYVDNFDSSQLLNIIIFRYPDIAQQYSNEQILTEIYQAFQSFDSVYYSLKRSIHLSYFIKWQEENSIKSEELKLIFITYPNNDIVVDILKEFIQSHLFYPINKAVKGEINKNILLTTSWKRHTKTSIIEDIKALFNNDVQFVNTEQITSLLKYTDNNEKNKIAYELLIFINNLNFKREKSVIYLDDFEKLTNSNWIKINNLDSSKTVQNEISQSTLGVQIPTRILPSLYQTITRVFENNGSEKLLRSDIEKIYKDYLIEQAQDAIEKNINDFINNNNLVPENDKLEGRSYKEKQCSTNWIVKKEPAIVFPPPGCGKYLGYGILLALIGVGIYYGLPLLNKGIVYYTISNDGANIRNSPNTLSVPNKKDAIAYGGIFKIKKETDVVTGEGGMWLKKDGWFSDKYGFAQIFVNEKDFYLLESIFGDETTKQAIKTVKCRKALIDYYKIQDTINQYHFFGKINDITYKEVYKNPKDFTGEWQVFCEPYIKGKPNSIFYEKVSRPNSEFTDFGFIVKNINTSPNIKRFVLYAFDDITEEPIYVGEADATGHNLIRYVSVRPNGTLNVIFAD